MLPPVKAQDLIKLLREDGWMEHSQKGSHKQFVHPLKQGRVTVPMHKGRDIPPGTLNSIKKQAGWK
jgi:predicted RNA binding protein YcfA (HicA-like mRNA interferase family)